MPKILLDFCAAFFPYLSSNEFNIALLSFILAFSIFDFNILNNGGTPQQARDVLPTSVKADIIMTTNIREWVHILELRALGTTGKPHPQMEEVMIPLAKELASGLLSDFTCIDSVDKMLSL